MLHVDGHQEFWLYSDQGKGTDFPLNEDSSKQTHSDDKVRDEISREQMQNNAQP